MLSLCVKPKEYPKDLMLNFVKMLVGILKESTMVKVFLYQGGSFAALPNGDLPMSMRIMRKVVGSWIMGLEPVYMDNGHSIHWIHPK